MLVRLVSKTPGNGEVGGVKDRHFLGFVTPSPLFFRVRPGALPSVHLACYILIYRPICSTCCTAGTAAVPGCRGSTTSRQTAPTATSTSRCSASGSASTEPRGLREAPHRVLRHTSGHSNWQVCRHRGHWQHRLGTTGRFMLYMLCTCSCVFGGTGRPEVALGQTALVRNIAGTAIA